jgi:drug/metabolite transporter (DMT)-like permease
MNDRTRAILLTISSGCLLASMDASAKFLGQRLPIEQVLWSRYFIHSALMFVILWKAYGHHFVYCLHPILQVSRSLTLLVATACAYFALKFLPLGQTTAIFFFAPVLVTVLSAFVLKEKVTWKQVLVVLTGLGGVMIIVSPDPQAINWINLVPLFAALMLASYLLLTRILQQKDKEPATLFYSTAIGAVGLSFFIPFNWVTPTLLEAFFMLAIGSLGAMGHFLLIRAFSYAPASTLSPFLYAQLVFATGLGMFFFNDEISLSFILGTSLLVGCGLYQWKSQS